jgi:hypothetical protein
LTFAKAKTGAARDFPPNARTKPARVFAGNSKRSRQHPDFAIDIIPIPIKIGKTEKYCVDINDSK